MSAAVLPLVSTFRPAGYTSVKFVAATIELNTDGTVLVDWPESQADFKLEPGSIQDAEFARGNTQRVYGALFRGEKYVAKRFYNVGHGADVVTLSENYHALRKEAICLTQVRYFLNGFVEHARQNGVDVAGSRKRTLYLSITTNLYSDSDRSGGCRFPACI